MEKRIFGRFYSHKKWGEYVDFKSFECIFSLFTSTFVVLLFNFIRVYDNFSFFIVSLQNIALYIGTALIGMLALILAGIAIFVSMLNREVIKKINQVNPNKNNDLLGLMVSYEFLAFNISIIAFIYYTVYIILHNQIQIIPQFSFYTIVFILTYQFAFVVFYTINLVGNSIRLFYITNLYQDISEKDNELLQRANEIRVDFIMKKIMQENPNIDGDTFYNEFITFVRENDVNNHQDLIEYFNNYYRKSKHEP